MRKTNKFQFDKKKFREAEINLKKFEETMKLFKSKKNIIKHDDSNWKTE